jgi:hypothetical protein
MKLLLLYFTIPAMCFGALGTASPKTPSLTTVPCQSEDSSLLKPTDVAYTEALEFARFLNGKGIIVKSVHGSKLNGFFRDLEKAAFFRTDKGIVEVIFFPEPTGAERVQVTEQHRAGRYLYSFAGQPHPNPPGDTFDSNRPMYFLMHRNWFIVPDSKEFYDALKGALKEG